MLGIPLEDIREVRLENTFLGRRSRREKGGILDIRVLLNNDCKINIELQVRKVPAWDKRSLFYLSKVYAEGAHAGEDYSPLKKCIVICVLGFRWDTSPGYHKVYYLKDQEGQLYSDRFEVHVIELDKELTGDRLDDWIRLFRVEAVKEVMAMNMGKRLRALYEEHMRIKKDRLYLRNAAIQEGRLEGEAIGDLNRRRQDILDLLEDLGKVPKDIRSRVQAEKDEDILRKWLKTAARVESFTAFRDALV